MFVLDTSIFSFLDGDPGLTLPTRPLPGAARFLPDMTAYFPVTDDPPELITSSSANDVLLYGSSAKSILLSGAPPLPMSHNLASPTLKGQGGEILRQDQDPLLHQDQDPLRAPLGCYYSIWLDPEPV